MSFSNVKKKKRCGTLQELKQKQVSEQKQQVVVSLNYV